MNGCTGLCCPGGAQAAGRIVAGSGSVAGLEGAAGTVCRLEPRSEWLLGSSGDSGAHRGGRCCLSFTLARAHSTVRSEPAAWCCPLTAWPGRDGREASGPPALCPPGLAVVLGQLCSFPLLLVLVLLVLVFIPSPVLGHELPEDRRCDLMKPFSSFFISVVLTSRLGAQGAQ